MDNDSFVLALGSAKTYTNGKISELPVPFKVKPAVQTVADLPATGNTAGDVRKVIQDDNREYYWDGTAWNIFGPDTGTTNVFIATYGVTTYNQIAAALTAGKIIFCNYTTSSMNHQLMLIDESDPGIASGKYIFAESSIITTSGVTNISGMVAMLSKANDTWEITTGDLPSFPNAINDRYLHTNASTGALEWKAIAIDEDAPSDGKMYVRKDGEWSKLFDSIKTWEDIQLVTRAGIAEDVLEIGQEFTVGSISTPAVVMGFITGGQSGSLKIKNSSLENGVIFQFKDCIRSLQFDSAEAFYYAESALEAGTYNFTINSTYSSWDAGTYQFTLTNELPSGGQLALSGNAGTALTSLKVDVYATRSSTTKTEQCVITSGNDGTSLGSFDGVILNHPQRVSYGNNRWMHSAMRQFLNSDDVASSVWTPQHKWDRPPSWLSSQAGFLNGLPSTFTDYLAEMEIDTYRNTITDGGGLDTTTDKIFLPGRNECYFTQEGSDNGVAWSYYKDGSGSASPIDSAVPIRIKNVNGSASYWWLRSPYVGIAYFVCIVSPSGAINYYDAYSTRGVAPAFVIA